jgi:predicted RNA-binding Zn-ribbon protein involved in translation (DUF1610 family)
MELSPQYVLYNEEYVNISTFADIPPKDRPEVYCPQCKEPVILKLGEIRKYHFAHYGDSNCSWSAESVLHFNSKIELAKAIQNAKEIRSMSLCRRCRKYYRVGDEYLSLSPFEVKLEEIISIENVGTFRTDISVYGGEGCQPMWIEIYVTHEMTKEKIDFYNNCLDTGWVEIQVHPDMPLPWRFVEGVLFISARQFWDAWKTEWPKPLCKRCEAELKPKPKPKFAYEDLMSAKAHTPKPKLVLSKKKAMSSSIDRFLQNSKSEWYQKILEAIQEKKQHPF